MDIFSLFDAHSLSVTEYFEFNFSRMFLSLCNTNRDMKGGSNNSMLEQLGCLSVLMDWPTFVYQHHQISFQKVLILYTVLHIVSNS